MIPWVQLYWTSRYLGVSTQGSWNIRFDPWMAHEDLASRHLRGKFTPHLYVKCISLFSLRFKNTGTYLTERISSNMHTFRSTSEIDVSTHFRYVGLFVVCSWGKNVELPKLFVHNNIMLISMWQRNSKVWLKSVKRDLIRIQEYLQEGKGTLSNYIWGSSWIQLYQLL